MFHIKSGSFSAKVTNENAALESVWELKWNLYGNNRAKYKWGSSCTQLKNKLGSAFIVYESFVSLINFQDHRLNADGS
jgi:hypothetical protein